MPHNDAILEQALAELAELSRRVADLTATVSVLAARQKLPDREQMEGAAENPSHPIGVASDLATTAAGPRVEINGSQMAFAPSASSPQQLAAASPGGPWPPWPMWPLPHPHPHHLPWYGWPQALATQPQPAPASEEPTPAVPAVLETAQPEVDVGAPDGEDTPPAIEAARQTPRQRRSTSSKSAAVKNRSPRLDEPLRNDTTSQLKHEASAVPEPQRPPPRTSSRQKKRRPRTPPAATATAEPPQPHAGRSRRRVGPMLVSTSLHGLALFVLAMVFVAREAEPEPLMLTSSMSPHEPLENVAEIEIEPAEPLEPLPDATPEPFAPDLASLEPIGPTIDSLPTAGDLPTVDTTSLLDEGLLTGPTTADLMMPLGNAGAGAGGGGSTSGMPGGGSMFFGTPGSGTSLCFMCDNSRSYEDGGFEMVVAELMRSVASLTEEQSFFVVFFSDEAYPMFYPDTVNELVPATLENKQRLQLWLTNVEKRTGGQGLRDALEMVESLQPASVCFLSDGDHSESLVNRLIGADLGDTVVNTFGMQNLPSKPSSLTPERVQKQQRFNQNLSDIAAAHGGVFTPIVVQP